MTVPEEVNSKRYIRRVRVEGLFGQFDHDLSFGDLMPENPNLLIFYGENGTGKTTLLWMIYHLLNNEPRRGHRTFLAEQQFKNLVVTFSDGFEIAAVRQEPVRGPFEMKITRAGGDSVSYKYEVDKDGKIPFAVSDDPAHQATMTYVPDFNFVFLPHDRSTKVNAVGRRSSRNRPRTPSVVDSVSPIRNVINEAIATARQQAITASNRGQLNVNAIYTELVRQIAQVPLIPPESGGEEGRFTLLSRLREQARVTQDYSKFGLTSELQVEGLLETLQAMPTSRLYIVDTVLKPFLQGNQARLQALNAIYLALTTAVESVNSLYLNKRITLHLSKGLGISTLRGDPLRPEQLSSGEQELLILFCVVISALMPETILFIDEPELSLNVSWQRKLLGALLKCGSGSTVQFVIATHSIEMLAQYRVNVARLSNKEIDGLPPGLPIEETQ